jgi:hypothetical protein
MKMISDDEFELSTGKKIYAYRLMLSIGRDDKAVSGFAFGYGADGDIPLDGHNWVDNSDYFTCEEQIEVAEYAALMWAKYLTKLKKDLVCR